MKQRALAVVTAVMIAGSIGLGAPVVSLAGVFACDIKISVNGGPLQDDNVDIRAEETFAIHGSGFPAATDVIIEFSSASFPTETFDATTAGDGTFVEPFAFGGEPSGVESWLLTVYDPADAGSCTDTLNISVHPSTPFTDIDASPFRGDIIWIYQAGITAGCTATLYCPLDPVKRDQMASFLDRVLDLPPTAMDFFDDDNGNIHEGAINRLAAAGITAGCTLTEYCPGDPVRRDHMASFLTRAFSLPPSATDYFTDDNANIHQGPINALAQSGITGGCRADLSWYCPGLLVTREQMAAFLHRALT